LEVHPLALVLVGFGVFNALKIIIEMRRIFRAVQPDVVHLVTIKPVLLGGLVARWLRVPALVSAVSGLGYVFTAKGRLARLLQWMVACIYSLAFGHHNQIVIFQNSDDRDTLVSASGLSTTKVQMIHGSGVDLNLYKLRPETAVVPIVLFAARLLVDKGIFEFVQSATLLRAKGISARFVLVGMLDPGNPSSISQNQLDNWLAADVVEYWGHQTNMPEVIAGCNLVVLPSYREGMPKVLLEAAAVGRAVVTTDVPGCRDAIEPDVTGLLVPVRDAESLALAIEKLLTNPVQRMAMGLAGRQLAEKEFDERAVVDKHLEIYWKLLSCLE
jgi:glycosyltransferase involved in cell wall biosynthesis